jgi:hypothetical protein
MEKSGRELVFHYGMSDGLWEGGKGVIRCLEMALTGKPRMEMEDKISPTNPNQALESIAGFFGTAISRFTLRLPMARPR